tara:strand:- start:893 stop:2005 length:1113 start_codon:yes stop_codon:yes gene_type:complete
MSLENITFSTVFGILPVALIGSFLFLIKIILSSPKVSLNSLYGNSLLLLGIVFTYISFFKGDSIIGNLSRIWISILIAYFLPNLRIQIDQWADAIRKIIYFHSSILVFDFLFETPWGWDGDIFTIGYASADYYRSSGLFSEPSFYSLSLNCFLLILVILQKCSKYDCLIVLGTNLLTTSLGGFLCTIVIIFARYFSEITEILNRIFFNGLIKKKIIPLVFLYSFLLLPVLIFDQNFIFRRLSGIGGDTSIIGRTIGTFPIVKYVFENFPLTGLGLGSEAFQNIDFGNIQYIFGTEIYITTANALIGIFIMGGCFALTLYLLYLLRGLQLQYFIPYLFILSSSGKTFLIFLFIIPAFNKYIQKRKKLIFKN